MSKTKRKYPTYKLIQHGIFYDDPDDVPDCETCLYKEEEVKEYYWEWEWEWRHYQYKHAPVYSVYKKRVYKKNFRWVKTGRMIPDVRWYRTCDNYGYVWNYHDRSPEGWNHANRKWCSQSVGKYNKRIREKEFRAKTKVAIHKSLKGYEDTPFPVNKNCDRWNYW